MASFALLGVGQAVGRWYCAEGGLTPEQIAAEYMDLIFNGLSTAAIELADRRAHSSVSLHLDYWPTYALTWCVGVASLLRGRNVHLLSRTLRVVLVVGVLSSWSVVQAADDADSAPYCEADQTPDWLPALVPLKEQLGDTMGDPVECAHPAGNSDDTLQQTTTGLAILRASTGAPTFTDGTTRWALITSELVSWTGDRLDPPRRELPCARLPMRGFGVVFGGQPEAYDLLGCPRSGEAGVNVVVQRFEHGWMLWQAKYEYTPPTIYTLFEDTQHYARFDDTYSPAGDPLQGLLTAPAGLLQPTGGFGKVWREGTAAAVRDRLGWAVGPETAGSGAIEPFQRGMMVFTPEPREIFLLAASTADRPPQVLQVWRAYADTFTE